MNTVTFTIDVEGTPVTITAGIEEDLDAIALTAKAKVSSALRFGGSESAVITGYVPMLSKNGKRQVQLYSEDPGFSKSKFVTVYEDDHRFSQCGIEVPDSQYRQSGTPPYREDAIANGQLILCQPFLAYREVKIGEDNKPEEFNNSFVKRFLRAEPLEGAAPVETPSTNGSTPPPTERPMQPPQNGSQSITAVQLWTKIVERVAEACRPENPTKEDAAQFMSSLTDGEGLKNASVPALVTWNMYLDNMSTEEIQNTIFENRSKASAVDEIPL